MTKIAVVGVMESVGREILSFLEEDGVKAEDVFALEPRCPLGNQVSYGEDDELDVLNLDEFDFSSADVAVLPELPKSPDVLRPRRPNMRK